MSASPERRPRFDPKALHRVRAMAGDGVARNVVEMFLRNAPGRIQRAVDAVQRDDASGVRDALHSLVSSAGQLGGVELEQLCRAGMQQADEKDASLEAIVQSVQRSLDRFVADLRAALAEISS